MLAILAHKPNKSIKLSALYKRIKGGNSVSVVRSDSYKLGCPAWHKCASHWWNAHVYHKEKRAHFRTEPNYYHIRYLHTNDSVCTFFWSGTTTEATSRHKRFKLGVREKRRLCTPFDFTHRSRADKLQLEWKPTPRLFNIRLLQSDTSLLACNEVVKKHWHRYRLRKGWKCNVFGLKSMTWNIVPEVCQL